METTAHDKLVLSQLCTLCNDIFYQGSASLTPSFSLGRQIAVSTESKSSPPSPPWCFTAIHTGHPKYCLTYARVRKESASAAPDVQNERTKLVLVTSVEAERNRNLFQVSA